MLFYQVIIQHLGRVYQLEDFVQQHFFSLTWCVWVFIDCNTIHVRTKSRYTNTINRDYSFSQLEDAIEDINKFIKEIKLFRVKERLKDIDKDFITDEELINLDNYDTFSLFDKTI